MRRVGRRAGHETGAAEEKATGDCVRDSRDCGGGCGAVAALEGLLCGRDCFYPSPGGGEYASDDFQTSRRRFFERIAGGVPRRVIEIDDIDRADSSFEKRNVVVFDSSGLLDKGRSIA